MKHQRVCVVIICVIVMLSIVFISGCLAKYCIDYVEGEVVRVSYPSFGSFNKTYTHVYFADGRIEKFSGCTNVPLGNVTITYSTMTKEIVKINHENYEVTGGQR